jgi:hypothetical protein
MEISESDRQNVKNYMKGYLMSKKYFLSKTEPDENWFARLELFIDKLEQEIFSKLSPDRESYLNPKSILQVAKQYAINSKFSPEEIEAAETLLSMSVLRDGKKRRSRKKSRKGRKKSRKGKKLH